MRDNNNLVYEYGQLEKNAKTSLNQISNISAFTKAILNQCNVFQMEIKRTIDFFFDESKVTEARSKLEQNLNFLYQSSSLFTSSIKKQVEAYSKAILDPLSKYTVQETTTYGSILKDFRKILAQYKLTKDKVIKAQRKYITSIIEAKSTKKNSDDHIRKLALLEVNKKNYHYEVINANKTYDDLDKVYKQLYSRIRLNEENRLASIKAVFDNIIKFFSNFEINLKEFYTPLDEKIKAYSKESDMEMFNDEFNFASDRCRFEKEILTTVEPKEGEVKFVTSKSNTFFSFLGGEYEVIQEPNDENFQNNIINGFLKHLSENEIPVNILAYINRFVCEVKDFSVLFMKKYIDSHKSAYFRIKSLKNLIDFSNVLQNVLLNSRVDRSNLANLSCAIVYICQRTYYLDEKENKIFLSAVIAKSKLFKSHTFWYSVVEFKLLVKLKKIVEDTKKKEKEVKDFELAQAKASKKSHSRNDSKNLPSSNSTGLKGLFSKNQHFSTFSMSIDETAYSLSERKKVNEFARICQFTQFETLHEEVKSEFLYKSYEEFNQIIKDVIPSFINFSFGVTNGIDFLVELCNKFSVPNELINFYVISLNTASYSIKQYGINYVHSGSIRYKIEGIKEKRADAILAKYPFYSPSNSTAKGIIIISLIPFVGTKDLVTLLVLSKSLNEIISKDVYKNALHERSISMERRLLAWDALLKINQIKKKYVYSVEREKALSVEYDKFSNGPFSIIDLDVQRTVFDKDVKESRKAIENVLKTVANILPKINYCQGMNFIASFLYKITEDEERSFYIMMGLLESTKFSKIFYNDLKKLKVYFIVFEKILYLYLPVTSLLLKNNNIMTNYYLSPWFITLFTNCIGKGSYLGQIVKIFDCFILSGWKSVFSAALAILEIQEKRMVELKPEPLLHFLSGDISSDVLFEKNETFIRMLKENKIKRKLIHNLKNEIKHEEQIMADKE